MKVQNRKNLWFRSATSSWKLPSWQVFKVTWMEPIRGSVTTFWGYKDKGKGLLHFLDDILWRLVYLSPQSISTWFLKYWVSLDFFSISKYQVWKIKKLIWFPNWYLQATQAVNIKFELTKNRVCFEIDFYRPHRQ